MNDNTLRLNVTNKWFDRKLPVKSREWRALRKRILEECNYRCRFCGIRSYKYMVCDHINGNAENNADWNLGINCPTCDKIRHCGFAGIHGKICLYISELSQLDIVMETHRKYMEDGKIPLPEEIDPDIKKADMDIVGYANYLLGGGEPVDGFKGFLNPDCELKFLDVRIKEERERGQNKVNKSSSLFTNMNL